MYIYQRSDHEYEVYRGTKSRERGGGMQENMGWRLVCNAIEPDFPSGRDTEGLKSPPSQAEGIQGVKA